MGTGAAALLLTLQACTPDQKGNTIFGSLQAAGHIRMASQAFQPSIERADHTFVDTTSLLPSDDAIISDSDFPEIFDGNYGVENTSATKQLSSQQPVVKGRSPTSSQATVYPANKELYKKPVHTETAAEDTHDHASAETTHREPVAVTLGDGADLSQEDSHHVAEDTDNNHHNHREPSNREDFLPDGHHTSAGDHSSRLGHDGAQNNHDQHANKDNATHKHDSDPHQQNTL